MRHRSICRSRCGFSERFSTAGCNRANAYHDSEHRFSSSPIASLQGLDRDGRVIYVGTLAAVMFPTLRLGFMVVPKDLVSSFLDIRNSTDTLATPVLHQMAMTDFIREGHFSRHIKRMRAQYMEARYSLTAAIVARADGLLEVVGDEAGMQLVTLLPRGVDDVAIAMKLPKTSVTVHALSQCYMSPPPRGGLLIGYATLSLQEIPAIVDALIALVHADSSRHRRYGGPTLAPCPAPAPG